MTDKYGREPMLEMFIFETFQLMDQLEQSLINSEKQSGFEGFINEIFRIMHTVKGSAAMMMFDNISKLAHSIEDLFFYLREDKPSNIDSSKITDIVLEGIDFIKNETRKIEEGLEPDGDATILIESIRNILQNIKSNNKVKEDKNVVSSSIEMNMKGSSVEENFGTKVEDSENSNSQKYYVISENNVNYEDMNLYEAVLFFEQDSGMENIRAFSVINGLEEYAKLVSCYPENVINEDSINLIIEHGFKVKFRSYLSLEEVREKLDRTILLKSLEVFLTDEMFEEMNTDSELSEGTESTDYFKNKEIVLEDLNEQISKNNVIGSFDKNNENDQSSQINVIKNSELKQEDKSSHVGGKQSVISVNIAKLDKLMDLVGELVISEAIVTQNPELKGLQLNGFHKAARQLNKITNELQDIVMSIRMVPLSMTFQKMNRIVRDMSKKLNKSVTMEIFGEETEVDKNIIERLSDPLIHLIRNSIDHGLEETEERIKNGKAPSGKITLQAKNSGGDVWITVKDDGRGLNKEKILKKAFENGLINKTEEISDKEIYSLIFLPGFSTKDNVTEFSGRGVGMDIVAKNIETVGGVIHVDSTPMQGTTISIKFPLTLAIIDGMTVKVGNSRYTLATTSVKESFRVKNEAVVCDENGNEMIMVRQEAYPVIRLHKYYNITTKVTDIKEGIIVMVESGETSFCIFADGLIGEQQVVVKALPKYIKEVKGIAGCTLLGDGSISLILDVASMLKK